MVITVITKIILNLKFAWNYKKIKYGGYGITVITSVCGTDYPGSIPGSHPINGQSLEIFLNFRKKRSLV